MSRNQRKLSNCAEKADKLSKVLITQQNFVFLNFKCLKKQIQYLISVVTGFTTVYLGVTKSIFYFSFLYDHINSH